MVMSIRARCVICKAEFTKNTIEKYCSISCRKVVDRKRDRRKKMMSNLMPDTTASRHMSMDRVSRGSYDGTSHTCKKCGHTGLFNKHEKIRNKCEECGRSFRIGDLECVGCKHDTTRPGIDLGYGRCVCSKCLANGIHLTKRNLAAVASKYSGVSTEYPYLRVTTYHDMTPEELSILEKKYEIRLKRTSRKKYEMSLGVMMTA